MSLGLFQKKIPGRGRRQAIYFSMGGCCRKFSNYMGQKNKKKQLFMAFPWVETSTGPGGFMICVFINMTGTPEGSTESGFMEKPGIEPATLHHGGFLNYMGQKKQTFCGFPWVETSTAGRVYDLCVYYMTGAPEGSWKVVLCGFFFFILWRSRESNLRPLVYKA